MHLVTRARKAAPFQHTLLSVQSQLTYSHSNRNSPLLISSPASAQAFFTVALSADCANSVSYIYRRARQFGKIKVISKKFPGPGFFGILGGSEDPVDLGIFEFSDFNHVSKHSKHEFEMSWPLETLRGFLSF